jgi:hypothetical protein
MSAAGDPRPVFCQRPAEHSGGCSEREEVVGEQEIWGLGAFGVGVPGLIHDECCRLREMLLEKNRNYGNSALDPVRIFSKADTVEQIRVRIDDKLSRLMRGSAAGEDVVNDLLGYLVLLKIAERMVEKK